MKTSTITVRVPAALKRRLELLSRATARSRAWLAEDAIQSYVAINEWQVQAIHEGLDDADADRLVDHDKIQTWLRSWGAASEKAPPR